VHIDVKHLPLMHDEERKCYLYVAIDRATRRVSGSKVLPVRQGIHDACRS